MNKLPEVSNIMALDVGSARIGVAVANDIARIPSPVAVLENTTEVFDKLNLIIKDQDVSKVVVGLPRNMKGEETKQSEISRQFAGRLREITDVPVIFADESLSTKRAEQGQFARKPGNSKHLDDIAACFILEEYFERNND